MLMQIKDLIPHDVVGERVVFDVAEAGLYYRIQWVGGGEDIYPHVEVGVNLYAHHPDLAKEVEVSHNTYGYTLYGRETWRYKP